MTASRWNETCGLAALHRLVRRHAGTVVELDRALGSIVDRAPDYPWLNALVCKPGLVGAACPHGEPGRSSVPDDPLQHLPEVCVTRRIGIAAALALDVDDDCSLQYVATRPDSQRLGHGGALLGDVLAQARGRGAITTSLQSSEAGARLYRRLGYRTVGHLQLRCRA